jgi:hypothetical protein
VVRCDEPRFLECKDTYVFLSSHANLFPVVQVMINKSQTMELNIRMGNNGFRHA